MRFSDFLNEAPKASKFGPKAELFDTIVKELGFRTITWPKLSRELLDAAVEETVQHWNMAEDRHVSYPYDQDLKLIDTAARIMMRVQDLPSSEHFNPLTKQYYDAAQALSALGKEVELYTKLVSSLTSYIDLIHLAAVRKDGIEEVDKQAFASAALKKLGATLKPGLYDR